MRLKGYFAEIALSITYVILAYAVFIAGHNHALMGLLVAMTAILSGLAGYKFGKRVDEVLESLLKLKPY